MKEKVAQINLKTIRKLSSKGAMCPVYLNLESKKFFLKSCNK